MPPSPEHGAAAPQTQGQSGIRADQPVLSVPPTIQPIKRPLWKQLLRGILWAIIVLIVLCAIGIGIFIHKLPSLTSSAERTNNYANMVLLQGDLEVYQIQNGSYPTSLNELVPQYASSIPLNPVTQSPYQYQVQSNGRSYELCDGSSPNSNCVNPSTNASSTIAGETSTLTSTATTSAMGSLPTTVSNSSGMPVAGNKAYVNTADSYSIVFPTGLLLDDSIAKFTADAGQSPLAEPPGAVNSDAVLNEIDVDVSPLTGPNAMKCSSLDSCVNLIRNFGTNIQVTDTKVGSVDARLVEYNEDGGTLLELDAIKNNNLYTAIAVFDSPDIWTKYEQVIRTSINSFAFTK